jgi:hypothetical protein
MRCEIRIVARYLEGLTGDGDRVDGNEAGVEDDLCDIVGDGLDLELSRTREGLLLKADGEVKVDVVGLDLVEVRQ